jgi:hypothetical protein
MPAPATFRRKCLLISGACAHTGVCSGNPGLLNGQISGEMNRQHPLWLLRSPRVSTFCEAQLEGIHEHQSSRRQAPVA